MSITGDGQVDFNGLTLVDGPSWSLRSIDGWDDLPELSAGDVDKPAADGSWPGRILAGKRTVTVQGLWKTTTDQVAADVAMLRAALTRTQDERPLTIRTRGPELLCYARLMQRTIPTTLDYADGRPTLTAQWVASDPRRYSTEQQSVAVALPTPPVGIALPFTWPVTWDSSESGSGQVLATNAGDTDSPPLIVIAGPVDTPSITNEETAQTLEFDLSLGAGEALTIDVREGTATLGGSDRAMTVTSRSVPVPDFLLAPGDNLLAFHSPSTAGGGSALATISWRDAYL